MGAGVMNRRRRTTDRVDLQTRRSGRASPPVAPRVTTAWRITLARDFVGRVYEYESYTNEMPGWRSWGVAKHYDDADRHDPSVTDDVPWGYIHGGWNYDGPHVYPGWSGGPHGRDWNFDTDFVVHALDPGDPRRSAYDGDGPCIDARSGTGWHGAPPRPSGVV